MTGDTILIARLLRAIDGVLPTLLDYQRRGHFTTDDPQIADLKTQTQIARDHLASEVWNPMGYDADGVAKRALEPTPTPEPELDIDFAPRADEPLPDAVAPAVARQFDAPVPDAVE